MFGCGLVLVHVTHIPQDYFTVIRTIILLPYCPTACTATLKNAGKIIHIKSPAANGIGTTNHINHEQTLCVNTIEKMSLLQLAINVFNEIN